MTGITPLNRRSNRLIYYGYLLSPELLGVRDPDYRNFVAGNVLADSLSVILERAPDLTYVQEFSVGLNRCKVNCKFFSYCQGAHAGNRYFEHGNFFATETEHCKNSFQAPVLALADLVNEEGAIKILERLAAVEDLIWAEMIDSRRASSAAGAGSKNLKAASRMGTGWSRKGGSHFKDGEFFKK